MGRPPHSSLCANRLSELLLQNTNPFLPSAIKICGQGILQTVLLYPQSNCFQARSHGLAACVYVCVCPMAEWFRGTQAALCLPEWLLNCLVTKPLPLLPQSGPQDLNSLLCAFRRLYYKRKSHGSPVHASYICHRSTDTFLRCLPEIACVLASICRKTFCIYITIIILISFSCPLLLKFTVS